MPAKPKPVQEPSARKSGTRGKTPSEADQKKSRMRFWTKGFTKPFRRATRLASSRPMTVAVHAGPGGHAARSAVDYRIFQRNSHWPPAVQMRQGGTGSRD